MPQMQLVDMRTWLRKRVGNPTAAEVPDSDLNDVINQAREEIENRFVFHKVRKIVTFPTVAPTLAVPPVLTPRYTRPTDCLEVRSIWNTGSIANPAAQYKLDKRDEAWLADQQMQALTPTPSQPAAYVTQRDWIELSPPPDDIYIMRLEYKASIAPLVNDTDVPVIPDVWHKGICYLARVKYWDELRLDEPKAQTAMNFWNAWIETKPVEVQEEEFADNVEGVSIPTLASTPISTRPRSSLDFDRLD